MLSGTTACCPLYEEHARETLVICILASTAEEARMEVLYESCCGLDIHKSSIACISFLSKSASPRGIFAASVVQHGIYLIWRSGSGRTIDFLLSERRDVAAAKRFFSKAMKKHGTPRVITLDAYAASHRAITEWQSAGTLARRVVIRSNKYLNNVVEQDHRHIKQRVRAMLGFKRFETAAITISGIELAEKIRKQQFKTRNLLGGLVNATDVWAAVLAA
jgi:hypothetical protein